MSKGFTNAFRRHVKKPLELLDDNSDTYPFMARLHLLDFETPLNGIIPDVENLTDGCLAFSPQTSKRILRWDFLPCDTFNTIGSAIWPLCYRRQNAWLGTIQSKEGCVFPQLTRRS